jgi:hypothetical protein
VDNLREYLHGSSIWTERPHLFSNSLSFIRRYGDHSIVSVDGSDMQPTVVTPQDLTEGAVDFSGDPILLVGRALDFRVRTTDCLEYSCSEVRLGGTTDSYVWCGLGGTVFPEDAVSRGDIVVFRGLVTALGAVGVGVVRREVAYFTVVESIDATYPSSLPTQVRDAIDALRKKHAASG